LDSAGDRDLDRRGGRFVSTQSWCGEATELAFGEQFSINIAGEIVVAAELKGHVNGLQAQGSAASGVGAVQKRAMAGIWVHGVASAGRGTMQIIGNWGRE
jgi:hypothetical protein